MALSIKSERADQLARELAALTGESITEAIVASIEARLQIERQRRSVRGIDDIVERFNRLPDFDHRGANEILGYDADGVPA